MPPRLTTNKMPQNTSSTLLTGSSTAPEGAQPKMTNDEKIKALRQAVKRQARHIEQPAYLDGLRSILFPKKRSAYPAHDDSPVSKRRHFVHKPRIEVSRRRTRTRVSGLPSRSPSLTPFRAHSPTSSIRSTLSSSTLSSESFSRSPRPAIVASSSKKSPDERAHACDKFMELPTEIHQEILRYLLIWPHDIVVFRGWSLVYPRSRPRLQVSILCTCKLLKNRGLPILFSENTFAYDLRDPNVSHDHTNTVIDKVFDGCDVPINEYGHLIRYIRIKVHRNRLHLNECRRAFESAILKFLPSGGLAHPANFHTLTLEVPAVCKEDLEPNSDLQEPKSVPICQYLLEDSRVGKALLEIRTQWVRVLAWDRFGECWETDIDMRSLFRYEEMRLESMARGADKIHETYIAADNQNVSGDPGEATSYNTEDVEAMEKRWSKEIEHSASGLRNLAGRIERLAIDPELVIDKLKVWRRADNPSNGRGPKRNGEDELVFLPSNFREPSLRSMSDMSFNRGQTAGTCSKSATTLGLKLTTKPKARSNKPKGKANSKAKTTTKTTAKLSIVDSGIFHARNDVNEAKLLEAQRGTSKQGKVRNGGGMLTEKTLEDEGMQDYIGNDDDDDKVTVYWDEHEESTTGS